MVNLTRINRSTFLLNAELIEYVESTPDTVITLTTGAKFMVLESLEEVHQRVLAYRKGLEEPAGPMTVMKMRTEFRLGSDHE